MIRNLKYLIISKFMYLIFLKTITESFISTYKFKITICVFFLIKIMYCVGQFCPVSKLCVKKPDPILSPFIQMNQGRAQPNTQCEGKRISEDSQSRNGQNYHPRRGGACLWGIGPCPRTMVTSGLLSEVSGELVNHSE